MTSKFEKMVEMFPNLYRKGFMIGNSVNEGWYQLLFELSARLDLLVKSHIAEHPEDKTPPTALQVKEKFGRLRFYMSKPTEEMSDLLYEYECKSNTICERCGEPGNLYSINNWLKTVCAECHAKILSKVNEVS